MPLSPHAVKTSVLGGRRETPANGMQISNDLRQEVASAAVMLPDTMQFWLNLIVLWFWQIGVTNDVGISTKGNPPGKAQAQGPHHLPGAGWRGFAAR
jgi:hypothetical protein